MAQHGANEQRRFGRPRFLPPPNSMLAAEAAAARGMEGGRFQVCIRTWKTTFAQRIGSIFFAKKPQKRPSAVQFQARMHT
jgi:hypothetical protein